MQNTGMGCTSVSWTEIDSWLRATELNLSVWEKLTLKTMSEAYAGELSMATAKDREPPYTHVDEDVVANRAKVEDKIKSMFASFKRSK